MKIYEEKSLRNFEFWGGAKYVVSKLTLEELDQLECVCLSWHTQTELTLQR